MTGYAHTFIWPALSASLATASLFLLYRVISRRWPKLEFRRLLTDRQFRSRHPVRFVLTWVVVVCVWFVCTALLYGVAETTAH
jgi:hypothetical protein